MYQNVGERIKYIRTKHTGRKIPMSEFANNIGVSQGSIALWESGDRNPSTTSLKTIANIYGVNESWLITGNGEPKTQTSKEQEIATLVKALYDADENSYEYKLAMKLAKLTPEQWLMVRHAIALLSDK